MGCNDESKPLNNKEIMEIINVLNESDPPNAGANR
jgi:hypothetical protein